MNTIEVHDDELDTILAALRLYQTALQRGDVPPTILDVATNGGSHPPLSFEEIDDLCENLN